MVYVLKRVAMQQFSFTYCHHLAKWFKRFFKLPILSLFCHFSTRAPTYLSLTIIQLFKPYYLLKGKDAVFIWDSNPEPENCGTNGSKVMELNPTPHKRGSTNDLKVINNFLRILQNYLLLG